MAHALVKYGAGRIRVHTNTLDVAIAALAHAARSGPKEPGPSLCEWLAYWRAEVVDYGYAHFHLGLDALLADGAVRQEFLLLIDEGINWAVAQGELVPCNLIHEMVGGNHWLLPGGWETDRVVLLLSGLRGLITSQE